MLGFSALPNVIGQRNIILAGFLHLHMCYIKANFIELLCTVISR
jgi:hypothetical protein